MYDYSFPGIDRADATIWSRLPVQPLAPNAQSHFSYSVLSEILGRAWYLYYDRLGFNPRPRPRLVRRHDGAAYVNLSLGARLERDAAGLDALALRLNGTEHTLAPPQKQGLLGGLRSARMQRRIPALLTELEGQSASVITDAAAWHAKTHSLKWSQAEILQVMEEIERVSINSFLSYYAARHNFDRALNQLVRLTESDAGNPACLAAIGAALSTVDGLTESAMAEAFSELIRLVDANPASVAWVQAGDFTRWNESIPDQRLKQALEEFLTRYGHRCLGEGELSNPRWHEEPGPLLQALQWRSQTEAGPPATIDAGLLESLSGKERRDAERLLVQAGRLVRLQSQALEAIAYLLAGTRRWAQAAAAEAMSDGRLEHAEDLFYFELEEIKQMMTGEWNISHVEEIRKVLAERRQEALQWNRAARTELLIDDIEAKGVCAAPGAHASAKGRLQHVHGTTPNAAGVNAILAVELLDSGGSPLLALASPLISPAGSLLDPVVSAANRRGVPFIVGLGDRYDQLQEGLPTRMKGPSAQVCQEE